MFGQPTGQNTSVFNFGGAQAQQQQQSTSLFGQTTQQPSLFGQQTAPTSTQSAFSFNQPATSTGVGLFGSTQSTFGSTTQQQQQPLSLFGQQQVQQQQPLGGSLFQPQPQQQQSSLPTGLALEEAILNPKIFNDERDQILGLLNDVQSQCGSGKAVYTPTPGSVQQLDLSQMPSRNRFKTIAYSEMKRDESEETRVCVVVRYENEVNLNSSILSYENGLKTLLGNNPVKVESVKLLPGNKCVLTLSVSDPMTGKKRMASDIFSYMTSANVRNQVANVFQNNFIQVMPPAFTSRQELEEYLSTPPSGLDPFIWKQAKDINPDPSRFYPIPLLGFQSLNERLKLEEQEVKQQNFRMKNISDTLFSLEKSIESSKSKLEECRKRNIPLKLKVIRLMKYQEVSRMRGVPIQSEEDKLRGQLEKIHQELNAPTKFRGCLNELMSRVKQMQSQRKLTSSVSSSFFGGELDKESMADLKSHLKRESEAIGHLLTIVRENQEIVTRVQSSLRTTVVSPTTHSSQHMS